jgi:hypothetical protein
VQVFVGPQVLELVRAAGNRLYVWPTRTAGCQPMTYLDAGTERPAGASFRRASFAPFELQGRRGTICPSGQNSITIDESGEIVTASGCTPNDDQRPARRGPPAD